MIASRVAVLAFLVSAPGGAMAQADPARRSALAALPDPIPLFTLGAAAAAITPADRWIMRGVRRPALVEQRTFTKAMRAVSFAGGPGAFIAGGAMAAWGASSDRGDVRDAGLHASQALVSGIAVTYGLKAAFGRSRPYVSAGSNPRDFAWGRGLRGGTDYRSLPSGHATAAFALVAALVEERSQRGRGSSGFSAAAWSGASLVALSRIYLDKHWASDVLLGAAIGTAAGRARVRRNW